MNTLLKVDVVVEVGHLSCRERLSEYLEELYFFPCRAVHYGNSGSAQEGRFTILPGAERVAFETNMGGDSVTW